MAVPAKVVSVAPGIYWVGVEDWHRRVFDALIPVPYGTSYNAYLVVGKTKTALVDTVDLGSSAELLAKVSAIADPARIDYVVMNHAEPDHAGSIPEVMSVAKNATLVATEKGVEMARMQYQVPEKRCLAVNDGAVLDLGDKTLRFVSAPWVHWPETMFTFVEQEKVLLPCDLFGAHLASDRLFDDEVGDALLPLAKAYYAMIMMPYAKMAASALDKALALRPSIIAPSHGPVYRNPGRIMTAYETWTRGPLQNKVVLTYVTMWGSTQRLAQAAASGISAEGVEVIPYNLEMVDLSHLAADLVDASAIVLGSPTVLGGPHPLAGYALLLLRTLRPRAKLGAFFGSYGWSGGALAQTKGALEPLKMVLVDSVDIKGPPTEKDLERAIELGRNVARKIRGGR
ncbi:MAG: FprA family A-type flavoprotein [Chloroflexota bacterium]